MGGEATAEIAMQGLLVGQVDARRLTVEADTADASLLAQDGATDLVVAVGAGRGGGLGQAKGKLDPFLFHGRGLFFRDVETMKNAVKNGCQNDPEQGDKDETAKESVSGREKFGWSARQVLAVNRSHATHQHGRFHYGIRPGKSANLGVTDDTDGHGHSQNCKGHCKMRENTLEKDMVRGQRLAVVFKGHSFDLDSLNCQTKEAERTMGKISEEVGSVFRIWDMGYRI